MLKSWRVSNAQKQIDIHRAGADDFVRACPLGNVKPDLLRFIACIAASEVQPFGLKPAGWRRSASLARNPVKDRGARCRTANVRRNWKRPSAVREIASPRTPRMVHQRASSERGRTTGGVRMLNKSSAAPARMIRTLTTPN